MVFFVLKRRYLAIIEITVATVVLGSFFAFWQAGTASSGNTAVVVIQIPKGAYNYPTSWNQSQPIVSNSYYSPATVRLVIGVNNTVTWVNRDTAPHTVTSTSVPSGASSFNSGTLNSGASFTYTFGTAGNYTYGCSFHPWMGGQVTVANG